MILIPSELLRLFWLGFGAFCALISVVSLLRLSRIRSLSPQLSRALVMLGAALVFLTLLSDPGAPYTVPLNWIYSVAGETALSLSLSADYVAGWCLGLAVLLLAARVFRKDLHVYLPAGVACALGGTLLSATSESVWASILGWTLLAVSGFVIRVGLMGLSPTASAFLAKEVLRTGVSLLLIWVSALGLEAFGFHWDFSRLPEDAAVAEILLGVFFFSITAFILPWPALSNVLRAEEPEETEGLLFSGILLPLGVAVSLFRWSVGMDSAVWATGAGYWTAALGLLFFVLYLATKSHAERLRSLVILYGAMTLSTICLFPTWGAALFILGTGAVVGMLVIGCECLPSLPKKVLLFLGLAAVVGVPGFLPGVFLNRLWLESAAQPVECGIVLALHALLMIVVLRETGVQFFATRTEGGTRGDVTRLVPFSLLIIFILTPWTTGTWTGGLLESEHDTIPPLQAWPWVGDFSAWMNTLDTGTLFIEGYWIQIAIAFGMLLLIFLFRGRRDPFQTRETSWGGFRRGISKDVGIAWIGSGVMRGLGSVGMFVDRRVLAPVWEWLLPTIGQGLTRGQLIASRKIESVAEAFTGERWHSVVSAPSYLIQSMTNGRSNWYLFFTILGTFLLVLHFVVKLA